MDEVFLDKVFVALYNARTQIKVNGSVEDPVNQAVLVELDQRMSDIERRLKGMRVPPVRRRPARGVTS